MSARKIAWLAVLVCNSVAWGQQQTANTASQGNHDDEQDVQNTYALGPDDQITIWALGVTEIDGKPIRIGPSGQIDLPLVGIVSVRGLTVAQLKVELLKQFKEYVREPQVTVSLVELRSQPVSVLGAVKNPGVHLLQGRKTLVEMLALAGGLQPDAGPYVKITRRMEWGRIPLSEAEDDASGKVSFAEVRLKALMESGNPAYNIAIRPQDVISIPRAEMVYVMGEVAKPGGFVLSDKETMSVLQALSMAGGIGRNAASKKAKVLRVTPGATERQEIELDLKKILAGTSSDVPLRAEDILFVPNNTGKAISAKVVETAIQLGVGVVVFGR